MTPAEQLAATKKPKSPTPLQEVRLTLGLRANQVCEAIGITAASFSQYELGQCYPPLRTAYKLMKFYGKTIEELWPELAEEKS